MSNFTPEQMELLRDAFSGIDQDDSGFIDKSELVTLYQEISQEMGEAFDLAKAEADFEKCDEDKNGKIDFDEFIKHLSHFVL